MIVTGRRRTGNEVLVTIHQPDGTLAQLPGWMMEEDAAALGVCENPRLPLGCLRGLRLELDACLKSARGDSRREGDEHAPRAAKPFSTRFIRKSRSPGDDGSSRADQVDAADQRASDGSGREPCSDGGRQ